MGGGPSGAGVSLAYTAVVLADTPLLYWRLGEAAGAGVAADASGNGRTGTIGAGVTMGVAGALLSDADTAAALNNSSTGVITSAFAPFAAGSSRTFELWINRPAATDADGAWSGDGANAAVFECESGASAANVVFWSNGSTATQWTGVLPGTGQWIHLVLTYNDSTKAAELFVNAVSQGVLTAAGYGASPGNFRAGRSSGPFNGAVDEIAVYGSILSPARIAAHYAAR